MVLETTRHRLLRGKDALATLALGRLLRTYTRPIPFSFFQSLSIPFKSPTMASTTSDKLSEQCQQEFDVMNAIYDQEVIFLAPNHLKVCAPMSNSLSALTC